MQSSITAEELFGRITQLLDEAKEAPQKVNSTMHETLVLACQAGTAGSGQAFGNLFAQLDFLCKRLDIAQRDAADMQQMRRDSNHADAISPDVLPYDARALALLVAAVFDKSIPDELAKRIPHTNRPTQAEKGRRYQCVRCIVQTWDNTKMGVSIDVSGAAKQMEVDYGTVHDGIDLTYLRTMLRQGMQLNLLDCAEPEGHPGTLMPRLVVVEPDYLIDISSLAACFNDYGHHPFAYFVKALEGKVNTQSTLLGNFAGAALDDIINQANYDIGHTLSAYLQQKALEIACCKEWNGADFRANAQQQVANLKEVVRLLVAQYGREKMILEPSFVSERLGLQGRVDLMTTDFRLLVEQKAGRNMNIERHKMGLHGSQQLEKHYVQLLLYFAILHYNLGKSSKTTDIKLLYSKYEPQDGLLVVNNLQSLLMEAMTLRNRIVATAYWITRAGYDKLLPHLKETTLNERHDDSMFYHQFIFPKINATLQPLHNMPTIVRKYFCRMMTFAYQEQLLSKVGTSESIGNADAFLWTMPLAGKTESGNIYTGLTIIDKQKSREGGGYDLIKLAIPEQSSRFLPNFRLNDSVFLYAYNPKDEPDLRQHILYKGTITDIQGKHITLQLADGQQNTHVLLPGKEADVCYAIEHSTALSASSAAASLYAFATASPDTQQLLLGLREPRRDASVRLSRSYNESYDDVLLHAKQAKDYYLLVGPPGTGKTSMAMRYMVEEALQEDGGALLLMSYTNRAVDEICAMLVQAGITFIRIGSTYSCDAAFRLYLLSEQTKQCANRDEIRALLRHTRVITGTTSMLQSRSFVFDLLHFKLAIIDEASQILEPDIIGLLASHRAKQCIEKFILIGDYKQLPAVVQQSEDTSAVNDPDLQAIQLDNCRHSLFERLVRTEQAAGRTHFMGILRRQGRMHPSIAEFPNKMFYAAEKLVPVPLKHQLENRLEYDMPSLDGTDDVLKQHRMLFIPSPLNLSNDVSEKANRAEARITASLLARVYRQYGSNFNPNKTVGVIVPYRNQIAMIRSEIETCGIKALQQVSIDTVERYQGSQRDVIIYSFTIQHFYQLDFLTANSFMEQGRIIDRKLNVAITRARKQLILTGNERILRGNTLFGQLIDFIRQKGGYYQMPESDLRPEGIETKAE